MNKKTKKIAIFAGIFLAIAVMIYIKHGLPFAVGLPNPNYLTSDSVTYQTNEYISFDTTFSGDGSSGDAQLSNGVNEFSGRIVHNARTSGYDDYASTSPFIEGNYPLRDDSFTGTGEVSVFITDTTNGDWTQGSNKQLGISASCTVRDACSSPTGVTLLTDCRTHNVQLYDITCDYNGTYTCPSATCHAHNIGFGDIKFNALKKSTNPCSEGLTLCSDGVCRLDCGGGQVCEDKVNQCGGSCPPCPVNWKIYLYIALIVAGVVFLTFTYLKVRKK